jgi:hypothetical protein
MKGERVTKKVVCVVLYWAERAGSQGVSELAMAPAGEAASGTYARTFDDYFGMRKNDPLLYQLDLPGHYTAQLARIVQATDVYNAHELLNMEVVEQPSLMTSLADEVRLGQLPKSYLEHKVRQEAQARGMPCFPTAVYFDGTPYSRRDGVLSSNTPQRGGVGPSAFFWCITRIQKARKMATELISVSSGMQTIAKPRKACTPQLMPDFYAFHPPFDKQSHSDSKASKQKHIQICACCFSLRP